MCIGYKIAYVGKGMWSFVNNCARNVIIVGLDNSSFSHADDSKNNFLVLCEGDTFGTMEALTHQRKSLVLPLLKQK